MSIGAKVARELGATIDAPQLVECVKVALQRFLNDCAGAGMKLPLSITLLDSDGDIIRDFVMEKSGRATLGRTSDAYGLFTQPFTVVGVDADTRIAVMKIVARSTDEHVSLDRNETEILN